MAPHDHAYKALFSHPEMVRDLLPLVLYNGFVRWYAKDEVSALIHREPRALEAFQPYLRYLLIDERQYCESELAPMRNLAAVLFRLERADTSASIEDALRHLPEWLRGPERLHLRRTFETWVRQIIFPRFARVTEKPVDVQDIADHWARRIEVWKAEWKSEAKREAESLLLLRLLEIRFGALPDDVRTRVTDAAPEQLEGWAERVVTVANLEAVFADDSAA
jgi:hypothetical protein